MMIFLPLIAVAVAGVAAVVTAIAGIAGLYLMSDEAGPALDNAREDSEGEFTYMPVEGGAAPCKSYPEVVPGTGTIVVTVLITADARNQSGPPQPAGGIVVNAIGAITLQRVTDADGVATFENVEPGAYTIELDQDSVSEIDPERDDLMSTPVPVVVAPESTVPVELFIRPFYVLQRGDNDKIRRWEKVVRDEPGNLVKDLQLRLSRLGYWISQPSTDHGFMADGDFGITTEGAVYLFQREHDITADGKVARDTWELLRSLSDAYNPLGDHSTYIRPGPRGPGVVYQQLPPSRNYTLYGYSFDTIVGKHLEQNWGNRPLIDCILGTTDAWVAAGNEKILVGDMSYTDGRDHPEHKGHESGQMVDVDHDKYCSVNRDVFDRFKALELADTFFDNGAAQILFDCKYVIDNSKGNVKAITPHHHHFHVTLDVEVSKNSESQICFSCNRFLPLDRAGQEAKIKAVLKDQLTPDEKTKPLSDARFNELLATLVGMGWCDYADRRKNG